MIDASTRCLVVTGDGVGNVIQSTRLMLGLLNAGCTVDVDLRGAPPGTDELISGRVSSTVPYRNYNHYDWVFPNWLTTPLGKGQSGYRPGLNPLLNETSESFAHIAPALLENICSDPKRTFCNYDESKLITKPLGKKVLALHMGSKTKPEHWKLKRYKNFEYVAMALINEWGQDLEIWVFGGPGDDWFDGGICDGSPYGPFIKQFKGLSLLQVAGGLRKADLFLGNDAGLSHVAAAVDTPSFIIYGPTEVRKNLPPANAIPITTQPSIALRLCRPCQTKTGKYGYRNKDTRCLHECMDISGDHIVQVVSSILERF